MRLVCPQISFKEAKVNSPEFKINVQKFNKVRDFLRTHGYEIEPRGPGRLDCPNEITLEINGHRRVVGAVESKNKLR